MTETLTSLLRKLDEPSAHYGRLDAYYEGCQPLSFLSPESRLALGNRLAQVSVNVPRLLVDAVTERLRPTGFDGADVWNSWLENDLDQQAQIAHREALILGRSFVLLWSADGRYPSVSVESARQMWADTDPVTGEVRRAIKRYDDGDKTVAVTFDREKVTRWEAPRSANGAAGSYRIAETWTNPLGWVPVVPFENRARLIGEPMSEMHDVLSLTDAVVKLSADMMVASEYGARPRRWASGIELVENEETGETVNPFPEGDRMMIAEPAEAKFGQLGGADLSGYQNAISVLMREISAVSGLPDHMLGLAGSNPTSADAIRASEAALTARAEGKQRTFGRSWEQVARMMVSMRDGAPLESVSPRIKWAEASTRSTAQEADAVTKLYQSGLISRSAALVRLGYSEDDVNKIRAEVRADALDVAGTDVSSLL